jgi:hypothetical protein
MGKDADVHIAVTTKRKNRWEDYVEEDPNLDNLTELVRHGVENYIERAQAGDESVQEIDWEPVLQPLTDLQGNMQEAVEGIQQINERVADRSEAAELSDAIYPLLPEAAGPSDLDAARSELDDDATTKERATTTGDARHYADLMDKDVGDVMQALIIAEQENAEVRVHDNGEVLEGYVYVPNTNSDGEGVGDA